MLHSPSQPPPQKKTDDLLDLLSVSTVDWIPPKDEMASIRAAIIEALPQLTSNGFPHLLTEALQTLVWLVPFEGPVSSNSSSAARSWALGPPSAVAGDTLSE